MKEDDDDDGEDDANDKMKTTRQVWMHLKHWKKHKSWQEQISPLFWHWNLLPMSRVFNQRDVR